MLSDTSGLQHMAQNGVNEKRRPVRRDPDRRRQQNMQAQRKYREKLRQRLDRLEVIAASVIESRATATIPGAATGTCQRTSAPPSVATPAAVSPSQRATTFHKPITPVVQPVGSRPNSPWDAHPTAQFIQIPWAAPRSVPLSDVTSSSSELSVWDSKTCIDPSFLIPAKDKGALSQYCTVTVDCGCSAAHSHVLSRNPGAFVRGEFKILTFWPRETGADPYANNLRLEAICTLAAMSALGTYIGITQEVLCAEESLSPFFRPGAASADRADNTVRTVQRIFETLKPDLRPGREQITVEHHPFIDILPFPTLRRNLITNQKKFDEDEFCEDILAGLVCWGGAGVGQKDREASTGYASSGTPWDVRSWEARAWFVKKHWGLLGGEDGELVRQSEWWRGIRGEESLDVDVKSAQRDIGFSCGVKHGKLS